MRHLYRFFAICLLTASTGAYAQSDRASAESARSASNPIHAAKEAAAQSAAESWLVLLDRGEFGLAWDACAQTFRDRVPREQWVTGLPTVRSPLGPVRARQIEVAGYKTSLPGAPDGEYVTIRFRSDFEKKSKAEELVTLSLEDGRWKPTGYSIR